MKRLLILTAILSVASAGFCIVAPGGPDDYSLGAEVIYAQPETRAVYVSGYLEEESSAGQWGIARTDPITDEPSSGVLVLAFQLPERNGQLIEARSLMFMINYIYQTRVNSVDMYGIGSFSDPNNLVTPEMHYINVWGADKDATALDQGVVVADDVGSGGTINTWFANSQEGALRLSCWLNSLYDEGAVAGDYALIRLNYSARYSVYTNITVPNHNSGGDNVRIYYDLVNELSETCPDPVIPEMLCTAGLAGDLTGSCYVGLADFVTLAADWLRCDRIPDRLCY